MFAKTQDMKSIDCLKKRSDFLYVQREGRKWISKTVIVEIAENDNQGLRFGLTVSKKFSKLAVNRNRLKRRLRAACYDLLPLYRQQNIDVVIVGRFGAQEKTYQILKNDIGWCLKKMDIRPDQVINEAKNKD